MTGPEHYREAERLLARATTSPELPGQVEDWVANRDADLAAAQVHATLAQVAALASLALPGVDGPESLADRDYRGWGPAVGVE